MTPRFEFRVFGDALPVERTALEAQAAEAGDEEARTDTYFVAPGCTDRSLKLRGGKLDLKVLRDVREGLELWEPSAAAAFPVAAERLRDDLLGPAGIRLDLPAAPVGRDLLLALARGAPDTRVATVEKRRRRYRLDGVAAEVTRLRVDGRRAETVAVEEAELDRALAAVVTLGLSEKRNTSYQRFLVELLFPYKADPNFRPGP